MTGGIVRGAVLIAAGFAALLSGCAALDNSAGAAPASGAESPQGDSWASIIKLPDWAGAWEPFFAPPRPGAPPPGPPPQPALTPAYAAKFAAFQEVNKTPGINFVSATANCVPYGVPTSMRLPYPIEFLFTPGRVTVLIETYAMVRRIYTDGRPMPEDPDLSYQGTSIGRWEGETLVVETTGLQPETSVVNGIEGHGPALHITERMRLIEPDTLEIETTLTDPEVFTAPYTTRSAYRRHRDWDLMEFVCAQNNRDGVDDNGKPFFNLERKPGE